VHRNPCTERQLRATYLQRSGEVRLTCRQLPSRAAPMSNGALVWRGFPRDPIPGRSPAAARRGHPLLTGVSSNQLAIRSGETFAAACRRHLRKNKAAEQI
jgi:hypothetical protein